VERVAAWDRALGSEYARACALRAARSGAFEAERAWQARWLAERLYLTPERGKRAPGR
jgi:hypothetical protein